MDLTKFESKHGACRNFFDADFYRFEFSEEVPDELIKRTITVEVIKPEIKSAERKAISVEGDNLLDFTLSLVSRRMIYYADEKERELFAKIYRSIVNLLELPASVKSVTYPNSEMILIEYGSAILTEESVKLLEEEVIAGINDRQVDEQSIEQPEEKVETPESHEFEDDPFPLGGVNKDFVEDDFELGVVEKVEEEDK